LPFVIAHRGASAEETENSLAAFRRAVRDRADGIELDVHATADGELIVLHDPTLADRPLSAMTLREIRRHPLENGEVPPTLPEALAAIGPDTTVFVEVKGLAPAFDRRLIETLAGAPDPGRCHIHSFDHRIIRRLQHTGAPKSVLGVLSASYPIDPVRQMEEAAALELWQEQSLVDADLVKVVHRSGGKVYAWTVDEPLRIKELAGIGVDGICTNSPATTRRLLS
jgi:glycerophosphoryl diester phosphodiesterase